MPPSHPERTPQTHISLPPQFPLHLFHPTFFSDANLLLQPQILSLSAQPPDTIHTTPPYHSFRATKTIPPPKTVTKPISLTKPQTIITSTALIFSFPFWILSIAFLNPYLCGIISFCTMTTHPTEFYFCIKNYAFSFSVFTLYLHYFSFGGFYSN